MRKPQRLTAVIFDFDGTLARPALDFGLMKRRLGLLARSFLDADPRELGLPALEWIEALAGTMDARRGAAFRRAALDLIADMEHEASLRTTLFEFTRPALAGLRARGARLAVITRNTRRSVDAVFPDARDYLDAILTRDDVAAVKPDPSHLLAALALLGRSPGEALMVGDHPQDVHVAHAAGTAAAAVASGDTPLDVLSQAGPDYLFPDAAALLARLEEEGRI